MEVAFANGSNIFNVNLSHGQNFSSYLTDFQKSYGGQSASDRVAASGAGFESPDDLGFVITVVSLFSLFYNYVARV